MIPLFWSQSSPTPASTAARLKENSHMYSPSSPGEQAAVLRWCPSAGIANARSQLSASPPAARSVSLSVSPKPISSMLQDPRLLNTSDSDCQRLGSIVKGSGSVEDLLAAVAVQAQHENAYGTPQHPSCPLAPCLYFTLSNSTSHSKRKVGNGRLHI